MLATASERAPLVADGAVTKDEWIACFITLCRGEHCSPAAEGGTKRKARHRDSIQPSAPTTHSRGEHCSPVDSPWRTFRCRGKQYNLPQSPNPDIALHRTSDAAPTLGIELAIASRAEAYRRAEEESVAAARLLSYAAFGGGRAVLAPTGAGGHAIRSAFVTAPRGISKSYNERGDGVARHRPPRSWGGVASHRPPVAFCSWRKRNAR